MPSDFVCLIGPGDAGKSTILDAIELALSPRWNLQFDDSDFFDAATSSAIEIDVTVGELPAKFRSDAGFGLRLRGVAADGSLVDEPTDDCDEVITVRLHVDASLEPTWKVVTDRDIDDLVISARDRERFGAVRLGGILDRHLSWNRASSLSRLTGELDDHARMLADAGRNARNSVDSAGLPKLSAAAERAAQLAENLGVRPRVAYVPRIDPASAMVGAGGVVLHDGPVPVRRAGLGTRRLLTLAIQREVASPSGFVLIDEVENGLEPFRLRRLLTALVPPEPTSESPGAIEVGEADDDRDAGVEEVPVDAAASEPVVSPRAGSSGRPDAVLMTSHSPIAIGQLEPRHLAIVRSDRGVATVRTVSSDLRPLLRSNPEAFLSRKVVVCEGMTEMGLLMGLDDAWSSSGQQPFAWAGVALANAGGRTNVGVTSRAFRALGYQVAVLADSDEPLDVEPDVLSAEGIEVLVWPGDVATEQRVYADLPPRAVARALGLAKVNHPGIADQLAAALRRKASEVPDDLERWVELGTDEGVLRATLGATANKSKWYKRVDLARPLGALLAEFLPMMATTATSATLERFRRWAIDA